MLTKKILNILLRLLWKSYSLFQNNFLKMTTKEPRKLKTVKSSQNFFETNSLSPKDISQNVKPIEKLLFDSTKKLTTSLKNESM